MGAAPRYLATAAAESARFALHVVRGTIPPSAPRNAALRDIRALAPDVGIVRVPAGSHRHIRPLVDDGLVPLHADTLVYYERSLVDGPWIAESSDLVRPARGDDSASLARITRRSFAGYRSHFLANPRFSPEAVLDGYVEWAVSCLSAEESGSRTWVIEPVPGTIAGYAACKETFDEAGRTVEIVLNAVDPAHARAGHYNRLLHALLDYYRRKGFTSLRVSTQIWNFAVQRIWTRAGLMLSSAFDTYHVNLPPGH